MNTYVAGAAVAATILVASAAGASAQTTWTQRESAASMTLELLKPHFAEELDFTFASSAGFITGWLPLSGSWSLTADLPFSRAGWDDEVDGSQSSSLIGNPYLGVEWAATSRLTTEFGARIPVGEVDELNDLVPMLVGMAGELERMEAFVPQTLGLYATADYRAPVARNLTLRVRGGPAFLGGDGGPDDVLLGYSGQLWYGLDRFNVGAGVGGRANVTTDDDEIDRTSHQFVLAGDYGIGRLRPGLQLRVPLDSETRDFSDYTLGISMNWRMGR